MGKYPMQQTIASIGGIVGFSKDGTEPEGAVRKFRTLQLNRCEFDDVLATG